MKKRIEEMGFRELREEQIRRELKGRRWFRNPIWIAIFFGTAGITGSAITSIINASHNVAYYELNQSQERLQHQNELLEENRQSLEYIAHKNDSLMTDFKTILRKINLNTDMSVPLRRDIAPYQKRIGRLLQEITDKEKTLNSVESISIK